MNDANLSADIKDASAKFTEDYAAAIRAKRLEARIKRQAANVPPETEE